MADCANCPRRQERWKAPRRQVALSGILNVDKPPDMTSHDVVDVVRRLAGQRKVGHAGTLDPMATGVLLVCLGDATRVSQYLAAGRKRYRGTIILGSTTDTYDAQGRELSSGGRVDFDRFELEAALAGLRGRIEQVPPAYSAVKQGGEPVYKRARRGESVELPPRSVEIDDISILDWTPPALIVEVTCSPGTYIRSLAHDLGQRLGSGAFLGALVRLASGHFCLEDAVSLERLEEAFQHGQEEDYLLPLDEALLDRPAIVVGSADKKRLAQGQAVAAAAPDEQNSAASEARAYSLDGDFVAIVTYQAATGLWHPKKVFVDRPL